MRRGFAYLVQDQDIVGDVWLYNVAPAPIGAPWTRPNAHPPFMNPAALSKTSQVRRDIGGEVTARWRPGRVVDVFIGDRHEARLWPGAKPGQCFVAAVVGPLAAPSLIQTTSRSATSSIRLCRPSDAYARTGGPCACRLCSRSRRPIRSGRGVPSETMVAEWARVSQCRHSRNTLDYAAGIRAFKDRCPRVVHSGGVRARWTKALLYAAATGCCAERLRRHPSTPPTRWLPSWCQPSARAPTRA